MSLPTSEVATAAQTLLAALDPNLHKHLGDTLVENSKINVSAFNSGGKKIEELVRQMIDMGFVSLLNRTQLEFVWDHNFLFGWRESCCALFCVDIMFLHRQQLMQFRGGVLDCLGLMRRNKDNILTSQLIDRFEYYRGKGLIPDIDVTLWGCDQPRVKKLPLLFNFKDENFKPVEIDMYQKESPRLDELKGGYDEAIGETMEKLLDDVQSRIKSEATALSGQMKAKMLLRRMMKGAIARRRVRKAKEARRKELLEKGLKDDTKDKVYTVVFEGGGSLGFVCRDNSEENLEKAKELGLFDGVKGGDKVKKGDITKLPEVSVVNEDSYAEKETVAPGDLVLAINGKVVEKKKLKKFVTKARQGGSKVTFLFMRGLKIRVGNTASLV
jgi:hypothetical protein